MLRYLRVTFQLTNMNVMKSLEYRVSFFIFMFNAVMIPLISLLVWLQVEGQGAALPYSRGRLITYYVLVSLVSMLTASWIADTVARQIRTGTLSSRLLQPAPYVTSLVGNNFGEKLVKLPILLPFMLLFAAMYWEDAALEADILSWLLFLVCLPITAAVSFFLDLSIGLLAFWIQDVQGLIRTKFLLGSFLAGQFIPLAFFPNALSEFLQFQPYRYTLSFPLEIIAGSLSSQGLVLGFLCQVAYCILFGALCLVLWRRGLRRYTADGA